jgi:hypothetical protein
MLRFMTMNKVYGAAVLVLVMVSAACTSSGDSAASRGPASPAPSASSDWATSICAAQYPTTTAAASAGAGNLRFFGSRPSGSSGKGNFADLPDTARVALCLVPAESGQFVIYGVPEATGRGQRLWGQNTGTEIRFPA